MDWGSVADWVAAVGTVGTLMLALTLFARERLLTRRKDADAFVTWLSWATEKTEDGDRYLTTLNSYNAGSLPIVRAAVLVRDNPHLRNLRAIPLVGETGWDIIPPEASVSRKFVGRAAQTNVPVFIVITDSSGSYWVRHLQSNRYVSKFRGWIISAHVRRQVDLPASDM
jgi:hypothetical protein